MNLANKNSAIGVLDSGVGGLTVVEGIIYHYFDVGCN